MDRNKRGLDLGSLDNVVSKALKDVDIENKGYRIAAYRLPIQEGKMTFSALDPIGDGSRQAWKTSFMWGPRQGEDTKDKTQLKKRLQAVTMKFTPFQVSVDGKIHGGGFAPDRTYRMTCRNCRAPFDMTQTAKLVVRSKNQDYCQSCHKKGVPKNRCKLDESEVLPCPQDKQVIEPMYCSLDYPEESDINLFVPKVYGVFNKGEAPGSSAGWQYDEQEQAIVDRYADIGMEIRPLKFLRDLYTGKKNRGKKRGSRTVWKKGVPHLQNLVVAGNAINVAWVSDNDLKSWPFDNSRDAGWNMRFPRPHSMTVV